MICTLLAAAAPTTPATVPTVTRTVVQAVTSTVTATVDRTVSVPSAGGMVTWAEAAQGIGAVLGAFLTFLAVMAALRANKQTRTFADREHQSAKEALTEQHQLLRDQARRDFVLDLLMKVHDAAADGLAYQNAPQGGAARIQLQGLLLAVPEPELPVTRINYGAGQPWQVERWQQSAYVAGNTDPLDGSKVMAEIGRLIEKVASADTLPEWNPDH